MAQMKSYIPDGTDKKLRIQAMVRFGYGRGSISKAVEEALMQWLKKEAVINDATQRIIEHGKEDKNITAIILFGSYARKEPGFNDVDVGFLVKTSEEFDILKYINLLEGEAANLFQITVINSFPEWMQAHIIDEGVLLQVNDRNELYGYTSKLIRDFSDNAHIAALLRS